MRNSIYLNEICILWFNFIHYDSAFNKLHFEKILSCITNNSSPLIMQPFVYDDGIEFSDETLQKNLRVCWIFKLFENEFRNYKIALIFAHEY